MDNLPRVDVTGKPIIQQAAVAQFSDMLRTITMKVQVASDAVAQRYGVADARMTKATALYLRCHWRWLPNGNLEVESETTPGVFYQCNPRFESCNCEAGQHERLCKHLLVMLLARELKPQRDATTEREAQVRAARVRTEWLEEAY